MVLREHSLERGSKTLGNKAHVRVRKGLGWIGGGSGPSVVAAEKSECSPDAALLAPPSPALGWESVRGGESSQVLELRGSILGVRAG